MVGFQRGNGMFGFLYKRLLGKRSPPTPRPGRREAVRNTRRAASGDVTFKALVATADQARDRGDWAEAARSYHRALSLYPLHGGYFLQLGHVLKEQGANLAAEVAYRNAVCLGELAAAEYLAFVAGGGFDRGWLEQVAAFWQGDTADLFATPPTQQDVADAIELLCDRGMPDLEELRDLMAACASRRALLARLLGGDEFRHYHADLLKFIAQTGWNG